jgi:hypothetical protein
VRLRVVTFTKVPASALAPAERLCRWLLDRAHGRLGNVWRDGLIRIAADPPPDRPGGRLSKRDARAHVARALGRPGLLGHRLVDLPRHQIAGVLAAAREPWAGPPC